MLVNLTKPAAEVHNIKAEIRIESKYIVTSTVNTAWPDLVPGFVRYAFDIPRLYKNTSATLVS